MIIAFTLLTLSCGKNHHLPQNNYNLYNYSGFEMMARGNCLPFPLEEINVLHTISVCQEEITNVSFGPDTSSIICLTSTNLFSVHILSGEVHQITQLQYDKSDIMTVTRDCIILGSIQNLQGFGESQEYIFDCITMEGSINWSIRALSEPVFYENVFLIGGETQDGYASLYRINGGNLSLIKTFNIENRALVQLLPTQIGIIWLGFGEGPYLIKKSAQEYELTLFNSEWNDGAFRAVLDCNNRLSFLDDGGRVLVEISQGFSDPDIIPFADILGLESHAASDPIGVHEVASNGRKTLILYNHYIVSHDNDETRIMVSDFNNYGERFSPLEFYIGSDALSYIITLDDGGILYGDSNIKELHFEGFRTTPLVFSGDLQRAAFGTREGKIIILDLTTE